MVRPISDKIVSATITLRSQWPVVHARNALKKRMRRSMSDTNRPGAASGAFVESSVFGAVSAKLVARRKRIREIVAELIEDSRPVVRGSSTSHPSGTDRETGPNKNERSKGRNGRRAASLYRNQAASVNADSSRETRGLGAHGARSKHHAGVLCCRLPASRYFAAAADSFHQPDVQIR